MKIGLALSGGGARGFSHIGVLQALEELKIKPDIIAGSSIGAIIGGTYSLYPDAREVERIIFDAYEKYKKDILTFKIFSASSSIEERKLFLEKSFAFVKEVLLWNLRIIKPSLIDAKPFIKLLKDIFKHYKFKDCKIPFRATAVDLVSGDKVFLKKDSLCKAVLASFALPGFFPPLRAANQLLVDGGVVLPIPVEAIRREADFIIGVSADDVDEPFSDNGNAIDIMFRTDKLRYREIVEHNKNMADFSITPNLNNVHWPDFDKVRGLVKPGKEATLAKADSLIKALRTGRIKTFFSPRGFLPKKPLQ